LRLGAEILNFGQHGMALIIADVDAEFLGFETDAVKAAFLTQHNLAVRIYDVGRSGQVARMSGSTAIWLV